MYVFYKWKSLRSGQYWLHLKTNWISIYAQETGTVPIFPKVQWPGWRRQHVPLQYKQRHPVHPGNATIIDICMPNSHANYQQPCLLATMLATSCTVPPVRWRAVWLNQLTFGSRRLESLSGVNSVIRAAPVEPYAEPTNLHLLGSLHRLCMYPVPRK